MRFNHGPVGQHGGEQDLSFGKRGDTQGERNSLLPVPITLQNSIDYPDELLLERLGPGAYSCHNRRSTSSCSHVSGTLRMPVTKL